VDLVLDGQHSDIGRHEAERSVAASAVQDCGDDAGMNEAMLLGQIFPVRQRDLHRPGSTQVKAAPSVSMTRWRAKLARTRCSLSVSTTASGMRVISERHEHIIESA